jgi:hypothetical protein
MKRMTFLSSLSVFTSLALVSALAVGQDSLSRKHRQHWGATHSIRTGATFDGRKHYVVLAPIDSSNSDNMLMYNPNPQARVQEFKNRWRLLDSLLRESSPDSHLHKTPRRDDGFKANPSANREGPTPQRE